MDSITPDDSPRKQCGRCKELLPLVNFAKSKAAKDGLQRWCRTCRKQHYEAHIEERREQGRRTYDQRKDAQKRYRDEHHEHYLELYRQYDITHREQRKQRTKGEKSKTWEHEYRERNRQKFLEAERRYLRTERGRMMTRAKDANRTARKLQAPGTHTAQDVLNQLKRQKSRCYYCHKKVNPHDRGSYHVDHVIPLARGGRNDPSNLVIACPTCNLRKHDRLPHEFPEGGRLL